MNRCFMWFLPQRKSKRVWIPLMEDWGTRMEITARPPYHLWFFSPKFGTLGAHLNFIEKRGREKGLRAYCGPSDGVGLLCSCFDIE